MEILGLIKSSLIDYPGKLCTVLFTGGCNFRCPYCHNSSLVKKESAQIFENEIFDYLKKWQGIVDGVCISGGEPTLQTDLIDFTKRIRDMGYFIKLDTNGTNPQVVDSLLKEDLIHYIAMDIKAPIDKYHEISNVKVNTADIKKSIAIIMASDIEYEFRTTVCKKLLTIEDIVNISNEIKGAKRYSLQNFMDNEFVLCGKGNLSPWDTESLNAAKEAIKDNIKEVIVR